MLRAAYNILGSQVSWRAAALMSPFFFVFWVVALHVSGGDNNGGCAACLYDIHEDNNVRPEVVVFPLLGLLALVVKAVPSILERRLAWSWALLVSLFPLAGLVMLMYANGWP